MLFDECDLEGLSSLIINFVNEDGITVAKAKVIPDHAERIVAVMNEVMVDILFNEIDVYASVILLRIAEKLWKS